MEPADPENGATMERDPCAWIATLRNSHERLVSLVSPLTPEQLRRPAYPTEWSIAQVLSHLGSGAEIALLTLPSALGQGGSVDPDAFPPIWDVWNAKSPDDQAADGLSSDEKYVQALEQLSDEELAGISMSLFGMSLDGVGLISLRLGEHALHTWDVAVSLDPSARVGSDAVELLIDNVPPFLAPRLGRALNVPFRTRIRTSSPDRDYLLVAADAISLADWPGDEGGADSEVRMPSEALLRLVYGRLDPGHTPAEVAGDPADLERLRKIFPGL
jgi:uncharacterized protein (TIGR03083 family)